MQVDATAGRAKTAPTEWKTPISSFNSGTHRGRPDLAVKFVAADRYGLSTSLSAMLDFLGIDVDRLAQRKY